MREIDLTGRRFGMLLALRREEPINGNHRWLLKCECGRLVVKFTSQFKNQKNPSCGCRRQIDAGEP